MKYPNKSIYKSLRIESTLIGLTDTNHKNNYNSFSFYQIKILMR